MVNNPWVASIATASGHICGGSLYAPDLVLTAAHRLEGKDGASLRVTFGALDVTASDSPGRQDRAGHPALCRRPEV